MARRQDRSGIHRLRGTGLPAGRTSILAACGKKDFPQTAPSLQSLPEGEKYKESSHLLRRVRNAPVYFRAQSSFFRTLLAPAGVRSELNQFEPIDQRARFEYLAA